MWNDNIMIYCNSSNFFWFLWNENKKKCRLDVSNWMKQHENHVLCKCYWKISKNHRELLCNTALMWINSRYTGGWIQEWRKMQWSRWSWTPGGFWQVQPWDLSSAKFDHPKECQENLKRKQFQCQKSVRRKVFRKEFHCQKNLKVV